MIKILLACWLSMVLLLIYIPAAYGPAKVRQHFAK